MAGRTPPKTAGTETRNAREISREESVVIEHDYSRRGKKITPPGAQLRVHAAARTAMSGW